MIGKIEILIIEDDRQITESLSTLFKNNSFNPFSVYTGRKGLELALNDVFDLIFLDLSLPDINSVELLKRIKGLRVSAPVIVIADRNDISLVNEATKNGADYIVEKPLCDDVVMHVARNALNNFNLKQDLQKLRESFAEQFNFVGRSSVIEQFREKLKRIAMSGSRALFIGEHGSGKERAAKFVHYSSNRATGPFRAVNCALASSGDAAERLRLESNLFGHDKGAFVGADTAVKGQLELADGGTLFIDEVGALRLDHQAKLLRAIETGAVVRLGASDEIKIDVRILAASTANLEAEVKTGRFREDLYFRLNVIPVQTPALRSYPEDIPLLGRYCLDNAGFSRKQIDKEAGEILQAHDWPGNLRQLNETVIEAARLAANDVIKADTIKAVLGRGDSRVAGLFDYGAKADSDNFPADILTADLSYRQHIFEFEKRLLADVLSRCEGNITKAAAMLKTDRGNLSKKIKKLGLKGE